ncbi:MAG: hypothetical protein UX15_C0019G0007 [Parcubacteria group bacterium GW2011_GWA1_45_7]|nr:MAG: hypothetical protein UX15_C0019G0007 [Parcubacteria group bacterium GW2011_GWA1_45_7]
MQTCLANLLFGASIRDVNSGCKAFRTDILKAFELRERGFAVEHEMTAKALKRSRCIYQLPIRYFPRTIRQGKKINFFDGIKGITALIRYRFIP